MHERVIDSGCSDGIGKEKMRMNNNKPWNTQTLVAAYVLGLWGGGGGGRGRGGSWGGVDKWKTAGRVSGCRVARVFPEERKPATAVKLPFPSLPLCQHLGWPEEEGTKLPLQCRQLLGGKLCYLFNTTTFSTQNANNYWKKTTLPLQHNYLFNTDNYTTSSTQTTALLLQCRQLNWPTEGKRQLPFWSSGQVLSWHHEGFSAGRKASRKDSFGSLQMPPGTSKVNCGAQVCLPNRPNTFSQEIDE